MIRKHIIWSMFTILLIILIFMGILIKNGKIWVTTPFELMYEVRGIDVSSYQGDIDWPILEDQGLSFAFIKATEGSSFKDKYFAKNWEEASKTNMRIGAYHFFSFESSGDTQADNFIETVPYISGMLPPVVDIEFYGNNSKSPPSKEETRKNLKILLDKLEAHYKMKPIIYATRSSYSGYIKGNFPDHDIWMRNLFFIPLLTQNKKWTFWQYNNQNRLKGYKGYEKKIDLNFFNGNKKDFEKYNK